MQAVKRRIAAGILEVAELLEMAEAPFQTDWRLECLSEAFRSCNRIGGLADAGLRKALLQTSHKVGFSFADNEEAERADRLRLGIWQVLWDTGLLQDHSKGSLAEEILDDEIRTLRYLRDAEATPLSAILLGWATLVIYVPLDRGPKIEAQRADDVDLAIDTLAGARLYGAAGCVARTFSRRINSQDLLRIGNGKPESWRLTPEQAVASLSSMRPTVFQTDRYRDGLIHLIRSPGRRIDNDAFRTGHPSTHSSR